MKGWYALYAVHIPSFLDRGKSVTLFSHAKVVLVVSIETTLYFCDLSNIMSSLKHSPLPSRFYV